MLPPSQRKEWLKGLSQGLVMEGLQWESIEARGDESLCTAAGERPKTLTRRVPTRDNIALEGR